MENSKLLTILTEVDEGTKTPFKAHNEILSLFSVVSTSSCGNCGSEDIDKEEKFCNNCSEYLDY